MLDDKAVDTEEIEIEEGLEVEAVEEEIPETEESEELEQVTVSIGDEESPTSEDSKAPDWVRELRKKNREDQKRIRELEEKLNAVKAVEKPITLGQKPRLEDEGIDYDPEVFEQKLDAWKEQKRALEEQEAKARQEQDAVKQQFAQKLETYEKAKASLKVSDFADAEENVADTFNQLQQTLILSYAADPAVAIYALGKNTQRAKELSQITDPILFAIALKDLEKTMKVTSSKKPAPETRVQGGKTTGVNDSTLERLRAEAYKTGDNSKVTAYRRQQMLKSKN